MSRGETENELTAGIVAYKAAEPYLFLSLFADRPRTGSARYALGGIDSVLFARGETYEVVRSTRDAMRELCIRLPAPAMSVAHARLVRRQGAWGVDDLQSTNGTRVNGHRIDQARLSDGDVIEMGRAQFSFHAGVPGLGDAHWAADVGPRRGFSTLVPSFVESIGALIKLARTKVPILLTGETGTGKEVLARAIHAESQRSGPFVAINCAALPAALLESLLFGHVKGAFSGALRDELGFVRSAEGGTLFLDEIADLPLGAQASLLRVLQEREVIPLGATRPVPVDIRVLSATHASLETRVSRGEFREDLYARLHGATHVAPPLRARKAELGGFIATLLSHENQERSFTADAARALLSYDWPRNVRELEQCLVRAEALAAGEPIGLSHLPDVVQAALGAAQRAPRPARVEGVQALDDAELRAELVRLLLAHQGNVADVARTMGKARMQIHRWIKRFDLDPSAYRRDAKK